MTASSLVSKNLTAAFTRRSFHELHDQLFPVVEYPTVPLGARILVQIASPLKTSDGGLIIPEDVTEAQKWTQNLAKVVALGPVAYRNRDTLEWWPEGAWCNVGDYIEAPLYGGHRREVPAGNGLIALFATIADREAITKFREGYDPLTLKPWAETR